MFLQMNVSAYFIFLYYLNELLLQSTLLYEEMSLI